MSFFAMTAAGNYVQRVVSANSAPALVPPETAARPVAQWSGWPTAPSDGVELTFDGTNWGWADPRSSQEQKNAAVAAIKAEIAVVEADGHRATREISLAQLAGASPPAAAVSKLSAVDQQIAALRAQLAQVLAGG